MRIIKSNKTYLIFAILLSIVVIVDIITTHFGVFLEGLTEQNPITLQLMNNGLYYPLKIGTRLVSLIGYYFTTKTNNVALKIMVFGASILAICDLGVIDILNTIGLCM